MWVQVFYPFVLAYLIASYLQGGVGAGSSGPLTNLRQYLWVPIFQTAYRYRLHAWQGVMGACTPAVGNDVV